MLKNYFKTAWRNLIGNISFSVINILGLAIGMASAILILLWIQNEVSHDRFHEKKDRLYILNNRDKFEGEMHSWSQTPKILGKTLKQEYPDVEDAVRVADQQFLFSVGEKHLNVSGLITDYGFLNTFSFPLLSGNTNALKDNSHIVLTEKLAIKLFGNENPMGKTVKIDSTDNFTVAGVLKDLPNNTKFSFEYLLPWSYLKKIKAMTIPGEITQSKLTFYLKRAFPKLLLMQKLRISPAVILKKEKTQPKPFLHNYLVIRGFTIKILKANMLPAVLNA